MRHVSGFLRIRARRLPRCAGRAAAIGSCRPDNLYTGGPGAVAARALTPVIGVLIAVGGVLVAIGYPVASELLVIAGAACLTLGVGSTGFLVLRESDADWEHTPLFRGFRPAAGAQ